RQPIDVPYLRKKDFGLERFTRPDDVGVCRCICLKNLSHHAIAREDVRYRGDLNAQTHSPDTNTMSPVRQQFPTRRDPRLNPTAPPTVSPGVPARGRGLRC